MNPMIFTTGTRHTTRKLVQDVKSVYSLSKDRLPWV